MRLDAVRDVLSRKPPFVTVHSEVGRASENARQQADARWTTLRHRLEGEPIPAEVTDEIGTRLQALPGVAGAARRTIVATDDGVVLDELLTTPTPWPESTDVGLLPDLSAWLTQSGRLVPFCLVVVDRQGADIGFHRGLGVPGSDDLTVEGDDYYLTKVPQGDWAQKQFQQTAENTWQRNAEDVADAVRSGLREHPAEVVLLAGDQRARHLVADALDAGVGTVVHLDSGGRAAGTSDEARWAEIERVLADVEAHAEATALERLHEAEGQGRGAVRGLHEVLDALAESRAEHLLVDLRALHDQEVDPAGHPGLVMPEGVSGHLPADRVLVAAAAATQAEVSVLSAGQDGLPEVAALVRWDEPAPD